MATNENISTSNNSQNQEELQIKNSEHITTSDELKSNIQVLTCLKGQSDNLNTTNLVKGENEIGNRVEKLINISENCDSMDKMVDSKNEVPNEPSSSLNKNNPHIDTLLQENKQINEKNNCDKLVKSNGASESCVLNIDEVSNGLLENNSNVLSETQKSNICDDSKNSSVSCDKTQKSKSSNQNKSTIPEAFNHLLDYGMSDSEDSDSDSVSLSDTSETNSDSSNEIEDKKNKNTKSGTGSDEKFRENDSSSDTSTYYDSDSSTSESADNGACAITPVSNNKDKLKKKMTTTAAVTRGELTLDDLPPIERLQISLPEQDCVQIGVISSIVEQLVIVQSLPGMPAYDIDTLLFLDKGSKPLGKIFDVLGPVTEPFYAVRFNSYKEAEENGVKPGVPVFCAPYNAEHTAFVFVSELMKMKGSDASWKHNNEPPEQYLDYSDDEQERLARNKRRSNKSETETKKTNSLERNKKFERHMNNKNMLMNQRFNPPSTSQRFEEQQKMPQNWSMPPPRPVRPEFCLPYGYFNQYGNFPMMPQFGMPPVMGQNVFQPFNPHIPPPNPHMPHMAPSNPHMASSNPHMAPSNHHMNNSHPLGPSNHHMGPNPHLAPSNTHMPLTNPHIPPLLRPQPVPYFPNPRHPRWGPPGPPGSFGNGMQ